MKPDNIKKLPELLNNYIKNISSKKPHIKLRIPDKLQFFISKYRLPVYFIILICYLEFVYRVWTYKNINLDYLFPLLFSLSAGIFLYLVVCILPVKAAKAATVCFTALLCLVYAVQLVYYKIFKTPLSLASIGGAGDAAQFIDIAIEAVLKSIIAVVLVLFPVFISWKYRERLVATTKNQMILSVSLLLCVTSYLLAIICVSLTGDGPVSQNTIYFKAFSPELSASKLGLFTTIRLDFEKLVGNELRSIAGAGMSERQNLAEGNENISNGSSSDTNVGEKTETDKPGRTESDNTEKAENSAGIEEAEPTVREPVKPYNIIDIDFEALMASSKSEPYYSMHKYFSSVEPTATNEYTGMFSGYNLIMLTAESFSPYVISPELTPTLYKMATEGFVFTNFYNPVWWVSTSDGEYVACTGLIPKSGVWSFAASGKNYMPFALGNQFKKLGYITKAYHNHTYTYYKRHLSHPNMGYDYKGVGNGLNVKKTWPESDLEMIDVTIDEYIDKQPFHVYYMTVSGHMNYNFYGNQMAAKNKEYVKDLPYSDEAKAYIACNLELEFAMKSLVEKLEAAGIAENTVIAISADHYPYGLSKESLDELAGHKVEENFELYKSTFILWKKGMEPIVIDKPCTSLDIIPTISNLFGLEYDSRLLMGTDILSDSPALAIFSNRSWITDRAIYNSKTNKVTFKDGTEQDKEYVKSINKIVANKFAYSTKILETDYYRKVFQE